MTEMDYQKEEGENTSQQRNKCPFCLKIFKNSQGVKIHMHSCKNKICPPCTILPEGRSSTSSGTRFIDDIPNSRYLRFHDPANDMFDSTIAERSQEGIEYFNIVSNERSESGNIKVSPTDPNKELPGCENVCPHCKKEFKGKRGVSIHIGSAHPEIANQKNVNKILRRKNILKNKSEENNKNQHTSLSDDVQHQCQFWTNRFKQMISNNVTTDEFNDEVQKYVKFLQDMKDNLPGPLHPSVKFFRLRKNKKNAITNRTYTQSSNPQRADKKARQRRKDQYNYDVAQYYYYNQRKKVVRKIMDENMGKVCKIKIEEIEKKFKESFEKSNEKVLESYNVKEESCDITLTIEDFIKAIKSTSLDTSAGPDKVLIKTIKTLKAAETIKLVAELMLKLSFVPVTLRKARTILIFKGGDEKEINNWRPITIFSVVRRVIEKVLDRKLREMVDINHDQRGFVSGIPGCHINTKIIDACLKDAKLNKKDCIVTFLDVTKAFDSCGHAHILKSLESEGIPKTLLSLIKELVTKNHTNIEYNFKNSSEININRGVCQGSPLSPILFNVAVNFIYNELCDIDYANLHGYKLKPNCDAISLCGFADDKAVMSNSTQCATASIQLIKSLLQQIGLDINPRKSNSITLKKGILSSEGLRLLSGDIIKGISGEETIKYLGCTFNDEIVFDYDVADIFSKNCQKLIVSPLLKPDQKLSIVNQYLFPTLMYPLQVAHISKVPAALLENLDIIIRRSVKEIIGLPTHTINAMLYAQRKFRGLAVINCRWEFYLQHFSIAKKLLNVDDELLHISFDCEAEIKTCLDQLHVAGRTSRDLRAELRMKAFEEWSHGKYQGIGVIHFAQYTQTNQFVVHKNSLSSSEWTAAIKLNVNYANLAGVPGAQSEARSSNLCRHCHREKEIPSHVLGACPHNENLITARHHKVKKSLIQLLREKEVDCFEEVFCYDSSGCKRFCDIVAFPKNEKIAYIIDPTVRFEINDLEQAKTVDQEKKNIYEPCIQNLKMKYEDQYPGREYEVLGLCFGSRGTVSPILLDFFKKFNLKPQELCTIAETVLKDSIHILKHHIYS